MKAYQSVRFFIPERRGDVRIPDEIIQTDEAINLWKNRKLLNNNDRDIFEYFAKGVNI